LLATAVFAAGFAAGLVAVLDPSFEAAAVFDAAILEAAVFEAAAFEAAVFEAAALADILAVLLGISPLLALEDLVAEPLAAVRVTRVAVRARALFAPRLAADAVEVFFLRVFCDTACAWIMPRPIGCFHRGPCGPEAVENVVKLRKRAQYSTFPAKINDLYPTTRVQDGF
jgi:hypothetical protein